MHRKTNRSDVRHRFGVYTEADFRLDHPATPAPEVPRAMAREARGEGEGDRPRPLRARLERRRGGGGPAQPHT